MTIINQSQTATAIESFQSLLNQGQRLNQITVTREMNEIYGDSANGKWHWKKAFDLIEGSLSKYLATRSNITLTDIEKLQALIPHQRMRSEEQIALQQFSTPVNLAFLVATALGSLKSTDLLLEPSAGTGLLPAMSIAKFGATPSLILNEISPQRREILASVFPVAKIHNINGEFINDFLAKESQPDLIEINPPFSVSPSRSKRNPDACLKHLRSALMRLKTGGRLVAIVAHWLSPEKYVEYFASLPAQLQLSAFVPGKHYRYHGTTMDVRLLVFDKIDSRTPIKSIDNASAELDFLLQLASQLPNRQSTAAVEPVAVKVPNFLSTLPLFQFTNNWSEPIPTLQPSSPTAVATLKTKAKTNKQSIVTGFSPLAFGEIAQLTYKPASNSEVIFNDGTYQDYQLSAIEINGGGQHPAELAESIAMASIKMPYPRSTPLLPQRVLDEQMVSKEQLEALIYAEEAHNQLMDTPWILNENGSISVAKEDDPLGKYHRKGYAIGDGTGVGKGLEACLIFLSNLLAGRTKAIWITKNDDLLEDSRKYWSMLGGDPNTVVSLSKYPQGSKIDLNEGILFVTYGTLRTGEKDGKISRVKQIVNWVGADWDGAICLDEAHLLGNCAGDEGSRGRTKASHQGMAGMKLINTLYNARVTYLSATAASKVASLAYCQRLGLWQTNQFPYHSREDFLSTMESGGTAVLEVIAQDLKRCGLYMARTLSFKGVKFETSQHILTDSQIAVWDTYAEAFQIIHQNLEGIWDMLGISENGKCINSKAKSDVIGAFEGLKLRFFNSLLCAMKAPTLIKHIEQDIANGHAAVVQLISTGQAMLDRKLAQIDTSDWENLRSMDFTPREDVLNYLFHTFPTKLYQICEDENGNKISKLMRDELDNAIESQEALALRDRMIQDISLLPPIAGLLDQLNWHFGTDKVAEITTRDRRIIYDRANDSFKLDNRGSKSKIVETEAFQNDRKQILVFSAAGGTGRSYQAELSVKNQRLRRHYVVEGGWQATVAVQGIGRTHRSSQKQPPEVILLTTNVKGELRFTSTIAGRLSVLGAISKGQQNTGNNGLFDESTNDFGSIYAKTALVEFYQQLVRNGYINSITFSQFTACTGLKLADEKQGLLTNLPPIHTFLNRILALPIDLQNEVFEIFQTFMSRRILEAKANDSYNRGMETLVAAGGFKLIEQQKLADETTCYSFERYDRSSITSLQEARRLEQTDKFTACRNLRTNEVALIQVFDINVRYGENISDKMELITPVYAGKYQTMSRIKADKEWQYTLAANSQFWMDWNAQIAAAPEFVSTKFHLVCGLLLPVWKKIPSRTTKINRLKTEDGQIFLGRYVNDLDIRLLLNSFGINKADALKDPNQVKFMVMELKETIKLSIGRIKIGSLRGSQRMEILDIHDRSTLNHLESIGCFTEMEGYKTRIFIPLDRAEEILAKLI